MTRRLNTGRAEPKSGETKNVVVFVHGYGANGADLLGLSQPLAEYLPDTLFLAPDAPEPCAGAPMGFQWFPLPWLDGSSEEASRASMEQAVADLDALLDEVLQETGVRPEDIFLFGFSQGTMLSLHLAPRRKAEIGGVVGFSGRLLAPERLAAEAATTPPVILIHGDADPVVPHASLTEAGDALSAAGFRVYAHTMRGTGHGIDPDGLSVALAFLRDRMGLASGD
ncbi:alpha/beta hydrolase [Mangrovicoccus algicola]|uniref:Alpha/beta fold hydrolase n=1 Tax=Mangrovicoccus algicola TaxID=2771008 RepID=A0A8J6Z9I8_9RHOB|nr:alpha/beta fold hydrolase [Mangrovicoccus algicola]MBE3638501.1 alpha/beta fold hydrolase [Mangrovicoccus algicola]